MRKSAPLFCALLLSLSARRAWIEIAVRLYFLLAFFCHFAACAVAFKLGQLNLVFHKSHPEPRFHHVRCAVIANTFLNVKIIPVFVCNGQNRIVRTFFFGIAYCNNGFRRFIRQIKVSAQLIFWVQLPFPLNRACHKQRTPAGIIH